MSPLRQILWAACLREGAARLVERDGMGGVGEGSQHTPQAPSLPINCCAKFGSAGPVSERV